MSESRPSEDTLDLALSIWLAQSTPAIKIHLGLDVWIVIYQQGFNATVTLGFGLQMWEHEWTYERHAEAVKAVIDWLVKSRDEPEGWIRHVPSYRRRPPGGDKSFEVVRY